MRLTGLHVRSLPGVSGPYSLEGISPHVTVVLGPNASGKSSLVRALRALLEPAFHQGQPVDVTAVFTAPGGARLIGSRFGDQIRWERDGRPTEPPTTPPPHLLGSYLIPLEGLMASGPTEAAIARRAARELSSGFDLASAEDKLTVALSGHRNAANALAAARHDLRELRGEANALRERLRGRAALEEALAQHAARAAMIAKWEAAASAIEAQERMAAARAELSAFPAAAARLTGRESGELADLEARAAEARAALRSESAAVRAADTALADSGVEASELDAARLERLERAAARLEALAEKDSALKARFANALARYRSALQLKEASGEGALGAAAGAVGAGNLDEAESLLRARLNAAARVSNARAQLGGLEAERAALVEAAAQGATELSGAQLQAAKVALTNWLSQLGPARRRSWAAILLGGSSVASLLLALSLIGGTPHLGAPGLGGLAAPAVVEAVARGGAAPLLLAGGAVLSLLVGGALALLSGEERRAAKERRSLKAAYLASGGPPPERWRAAEVSARLSELLTTGATRREAKTRAAALDAVEARLAREVTRAAAELQRVEARLKEHALGAGYLLSGDERDVAAGYALWLSAVREAAALGRELGGLREERNSVAAEAAALRAEIVNGLEGTPFAAQVGAPGPAAGSSASELRVATNRLAGAARAAERARAERARALSAAESARTELRRVEEARARLLRGLGIDPANSEAGAELAALTRLREPYQEAAAQLTRSEGAAHAKLEELAGEPQLLALVEARDLHAATLGAKEAREAAAEQERLTEELWELERAAGEAGRSRRLTEAKARERHALDELQNHLRRAEENALVSLLFREVGESHRATRQPALLAAASSWFQRFTRNAYALEFEQGRGFEGVLRARDRSNGRVLELAALSSGTRAQLLLALRVAHAVHAEGSGAKLPFFLDEALTTADGARFREVASSLLELAVAEGRQLIYLSAREADAEAWLRAARAHGSGLEPVRVVTLAGLRPAEEQEREARSR